MLPDPPPDPFKNLDPAQTVRVLPRHLAGPSQADLKTIWIFPFDDGCHLHQGLEGMGFAISPCARLWTRFALKPEERGPGTNRTSSSGWPAGGKVRPGETPESPVADSRRHSKWWRRSGVTSALRGACD